MSAGVDEADSIRAVSRDIHEFCCDSDDVVNGRVVELLAARRSLISERRGMNAILMRARRHAQ